MIIYNLLTKIGSNIQVIVETSKDQTVLFDDSSDYLLTERKDLSQLSIYSLNLNVFFIFPILRIRSVFFIERRGKYD